MSLLQKVFKTFFGDKSSKDIKKMLPIVQQINAEFAKLKDLSNDELRALTAKLRLDLKESIKEEEKKTC